jgi:UDP-glucose 4-epimerase
MKENKKIKKVLVTGSAGTVGNFVVQKLLEAGYEVRGVDIRPTPTGELGDVPLDKLEIVTGDLTDKEFARSAARGMDAVIHTAALIDIALSYKELAPLNVQAVRYLYEAAKNGGARVFVHFSSGSIYYPEGVLVTEETPIRPKSAYEQTKAESEDLLRVLGTDNKLPYVILRPGLIYGPRGRFLANGFSAIPAVMRYMMGKVVPGFDGGPRTNLVHAEDVARAAVFLMETPESWKKEYNVADKTILSFGEIITTNVRAYGLRTAATVTIPSPKITRPLRPILDTDLFFKAANLPMDFAWNKLIEEFEIEPALHPRLDRETAPYMFHNVIFSTERISRLGFTFKHEDYRKSLPEVMRWYIQNRWIPDYDEIPPGAGWTPRVGFIFSERMSGSYRLTDSNGKKKKADLPFGNNGHELPMEFEIDATAKRVERFLFNPTTRIRGSIYMEGLGRHVPIEGTLTIPLLLRRKIIYEFTFKPDEGSTYRFSGEKNVKITSPLDTMTTLPGRIMDENGKEVATAMVRFNLRKDLIPFIRSFGWMH